MSTPTPAPPGDGRRCVFPDFAATSPLAPAAQEAMRPAEEQAFGHAKFAHWADVTANRVLEAARRAVAWRAGFGDRVVFTSGATESNWLAISGLLATSPKERLLTSTIEHDSVLAARNYVRSIDMLRTILLSARQAGSDGRLLRTRRPAQNIAL